MGKAYARTLNNRSAEYSASAQIGKVRPALRFHLAFRRVFLTRLHLATILDALFRSVQEARWERNSMRIHPLDLAIVIAYLLGVTALGMRFRRGQQNATDYFLGGRSAPWWALAFSIVATETSTLTIIGTPAIAYGGHPT